MVKNQRNSCCHMGCPPMIGDLHFHRGYSLRLQESVALHLTVVQLTCNENGGPNILLLACFHTTPGGPSWTPQPHSAPIGTVLPEAKRARAISVSIRRRNNGSSVTSVTKPSAPAKTPSSIGCAPRQRPW